MNEHEHNHIYITDVFILYVHLLQICFEFNEVWFEEKNIYSDKKYAFTSSVAELR